MPLMNYYLFSKDKYRQTQSQDELSRITYLGYIDRIIHDKEIKDINEINHEFQFDCDEATFMQNRFINSLKNDNQFINSYLFQKKIGIEDLLLEEEANQISDRILVLNANHDDIYKGIVGYSKDDLLKCKTKKKEIEVVDNINNNLIQVVPILNDYYSYLKKENIMIPNIQDPSLYESEMIAHDWLYNKSDQIQTIVSYKPIKKALLNFFLDNIVISYYKNDFHFFEDNLDKFSKHLFKNELELLSDVVQVVKDYNGKF